MFDECDKHIQFFIIAVLPNLLFEIHELIT